MRHLKLVVLVLLVGLLVGAAQAQDMEYEVVAEGLNSPRQITVAEDGTIFIAEAGLGGEEMAADEFGGETPIGNSARVTMVSPEGDQSVMVEGLFSRGYFGGFLGAHKFLRVGDVDWLLLGEGLPAENMPDGANQTSVLATVADGELTVVADLLAAETAENPDGEDVVSNPTDFAVGADGEIYIVDSSANVLWVYTEADGVSAAVVWPLTNDVSAVPTSVEVGADGSIYVGFLGGFPFLPADQGGTARIERWVDGEVAETFTGVNLVTDFVVADDGTIYAVQLADGFGDQGYNPDSGSVVMVTGDGVTAIAEELPYPYGIAMDANGDLLVGINTSYVAPDSAQVVRIPTGM
ncbi:MAG: ScyD/ScyE family protein [Chloroflexota bacterium]|nr:ScyD/ScyE family protein [Chloroflexota bacterium]